MRKLLIFLLILTILCSTSCSRDIVSDDNKLNIVCTVFPQYDFVREIAGSKVNVSMLIPPGSEAHSYEPSPKDIISLKNADLFIMIGGESEHWATHLLEGDELNCVPTLKLIDYVIKHEEEHTEGMETSGHNHKHTSDCDKSHKETVHQYDEHIWTSPKNAALMCKAISSYLEDIDRDNATYYRNNCSSYIKKLDDLALEYKNAVQNGKRNTLIFGDRFPLRYLTEEISLDYYAAFPGCSSRTEPSAKTVAFLSDKLKEDDIPIVFYMDYSDGRIAKTIAKDTNAKAARLYSCHNLSQKDLSNGETYLSLMKKNLIKIKEALS